MAKVNKFGALSAALQGKVLPEQAEPDQEMPKQTEGEQLSQMLEPVRKGRQKGKRSDPNYLQVGAYIPKALDKDVKRLLIDQDIDFSDLVTKLLQDWVGSQAAK